MWRSVKIPHYQDVSRALFMNASAASVFARLLRVKRERDEQAVRDRRDAKFEVLGSKFRKPRTSNLGPRTLPRLARPALRATPAGEKPAAVFTSRSDD